MLQWVPWLVWAELIGVACIIVGIWGLYGCFRPERAPERDVHAQADEVVAHYVKVTRLEWVQVEEPGK